MKPYIFLLVTLLILCIFTGCMPAVNEPTSSVPSQVTEEQTQPTSASLPEETQTSTTQATQPPTELETTVTQPETTATEATEPETTVTEATEPETTATEPPPPETTATKPTEPETTPTEPAEIGSWVIENGQRYYRNADGTLHTGWLKLDGERYYFLEDGTMATGCVEIPETGKRYFTSTGKEVVLVNPWNYVPEEYTVKLGSYSGYKMAKHIISPLKEMLADCKAAGYTAVLTSAYRSHDDQIYLHNRRIQRFLDQGYSEEDAKREAARRVAIPGTSEHELGLALDIVDASNKSLTSDQETMPAQKWLIENSWKYGFVLRYPNSKSDITGIIYEPWHYRYVGQELAKELYTSGLCLEEYLSQLTA